MNLCISKILEVEFINGGFISFAQDAVNDITQHCDNTGLKGELVAFGEQILSQIDQNVLSPSAQFSQEHREILVNNFGGLLQVIIVRIEQDGLNNEMVQKVFDTLTNVSRHDSCRQGALLILNGLLNTLAQESIVGLAPTVLQLIESTVRDQG